MPRQRGRVTPHASGKNLKLIGDPDSPSVTVSPRKPRNEVTTPPPHFGDERKGESIYANSAERRKRAQMEANGEPVGDGDDEAPSSSSRGVRASELVRAMWHAFPGVLTLWILRTDFATMPLREWRAVPVAAVLAPLTATCWLLEWARLVGPLRTHAILSPLLRENEHARIHGTAWYLLGVTAALFMFPADVAVCAICQLAFCDPVASIAGRVFGDFRCFGGRYGRGGKSVIGTFACFWSGSLVAWFLYCGVYVVMPDGDALEWAHFLGGSAFSAATAVEDEENVWTMLALCVASGVAVAAVEAAGTPAASVGRKGGAGSRDSFVSLVVDGAANDNLAIPVLGGAALYAVRLALLGPWGDSVGDVIHDAPVSTPRDYGNEAFFI
jgi:diacylglycerol kinase (CTP)